MLPGEGSSKHLCFLAETWLCQLGPLPESKTQKQRTNLLEEIYFESSHKSFCQGDASGGGGEGREVVQQVEVICGGPIFALL